MSIKEKVLVVCIVIIVFTIGVFVGMSIYRENNQSSEQNNEPSISENFTVSRIIDGDTIELSNGEAVRLIGINAPEVGQPYYMKSANKLAQLIGEKNVTLEKDVSNRDRYGRLLRYVYVGNIFVNLEIVREGYAIAYPYYPDVKYSDEFKAIEQEARNAQIGMWVKTELAVDIVAWYFHYDAEGNDHYNLNDEYVVLRNNGSVSVYMTGWTVFDKANHVYTFSTFVLGSGASVTLYTGSGTDTATELYWWSGRAIWNNDGDTLYLWDASDHLVLTYSY